MLNSKFYVRGVNHRQTSKPRPSNDYSTLLLQYYYLIVLFYVAWGEAARSIDGIGEQKGGKPSNDQISKTIQLCSNQ